MAEQLRVQGETLSPKALETVADGGSAAAQEYFANAPGEIFRRASFEEDMEKARGCFRHLRTVFQELEECRAFELLKARRP